VRLLNPARRGRLLRMASPRWLKLWIGSGFNPKVSERARVSSGAYAIRSSKTHVVAYVGESSRGTLWKTLLRHFQAPDSFRDVREAGIFTGDPRHYEVALHVTSKGHRPRAPAAGSSESKRLRELKRLGKRYTTEPDQRAMKAQADWIARLKPTINKDDGRAADLGAELREARARLQAEDEDDPFGLRRNPSNPVPPAALDDPEEFLFWARRLPEDVFIREDDRTFSIVADGRTLVYHLRSRELADWVRESWQAVRLDATLHGKVSELFGAPPVPAGEWGWSSMLSGAGAVYRKTQEDTLEDVAMTERGDGAKLLAQIANLGQAYSRGFAALKEAEKARRALGPSHALRVGDRVLWEGSRSDARGRSVRTANEGTIAELLPDDRLVVFPWVSKKRGGKQGLLEQSPVRVLAREVVLKPAAVEVDKSKRRAAPAPKKKEGAVATAVRGEPFAIYSAGRVIVRELGKVARTEEERAAVAALENSAADARDVRLAASLLRFGGKPDLAAELDRLVGGPPMSGSAVLRLVEAGPAHSLALGSMPLEGLEAARYLVDSGDLAVLPRQGRWPDRYVVTREGSKSLGTFESDDRGFLADSRWTGEALREKKAKAAAASVKPAGYGEIGKAGQVRMFNPSKHRGALVQLGLMTRLHVARGGAPLLVLGWSLRDAPILAYDEAGRLVVGYRGPVVRAADPSELREYKRTHWGAVGQGKVRDCGAAPAPLVSWGRASGVTYATRKGGDRAVVDYVHVFGEGGSGPVVLPSVVRHECAGGCGPKCAAAGAISLVGGSYRVTSRGIVG